jgi:hypothetical protein
VLADELYNSLPYGPTVNVKLAMCDGATDHKIKVKREGKEESELMKFSFASLTARFLWKSGREYEEGNFEDFELPVAQWPPDVSKIFIGGAEGAAYWDKDDTGMNAPRYKNITQPAVPQLGIQAEYTWEKRSRKYFNPSVFSGTAPIGVSSTVEKSKIDLTYCYFPFIFDLKKPLQQRE